MSVRWWCPNWNSTSYANSLLVYVDSLIGGIVYVLFKERHHLKEEELVQQPD